MRMDNQMESMVRHRPAWLEIDLDSLAWNIGAIRRATDKNAMICASMKSNAYGHGAILAAETVLSNGADRLSVAILDEALELRRAGFADVPILILGVAERDRADEIVANNITQTVSTVDEAKSLSAAAVSLGARSVVHIKIDSGMGRLGFVCGDPCTVGDIETICSLPGIYVEGIFTHFATADECDCTYTKTQLANFLHTCESLAQHGIRIPIHHCSNSAAIDGYPGAHMDMVRPGIALYGGAGQPPGTRSVGMPLRRVMSLHAKVALLKTVAPGTSISYGRRYTAEKDTVIATFPLGYGDGYRRGLSCGKGDILVQGRRAPIAGIICMDLCMADVTGIEGVSVGDEAVFIGKQGGDEITMEEMSDALGTIPYEIMCTISRRVPRVYKRGGAAVGLSDGFTCQPTR